MPLHQVQAERAAKTGRQVGALSDTTQHFLPPGMDMVLDFITKAMFPETEEDVMQQAADSVLPDPAAIMIPGQSAGGLGQVLRNLIDNILDPTDFPFNTRIRGMNFPGDEEGISNLETFLSNIFKNNPGRRGRGTPTTLLEFPDELLEKSKSGSFLGEGIDIEEATSILRTVPDRDNNFELAKFLLQDFNTHEDLLPRVISPGVTRQQDPFTDPMLFRFDLEELINNIIAKKTGKDFIKGTGAVQ